MAYVSYKLNHDLLELGVSLVDQGLQIMPMGRTKKPFWRFIPKKPDDTFSWALFFRQNPASSLTPQTIKHWLNCGSVGLSLLTGKVTVFDIDVPEYLGFWMQDEAVSEILRRVNAPIQQTGGGGYQIPLFVDVADDQKPKSIKLAHIPDDTKASGRSVTIELKGVGSYAMMPFSRHPSGNIYRPLDWFGGSFADIPTITRDEYDILVRAAKALCKAPKSRQQLQREERIRRAKARQAKYPKRTYSNPKVSVIDQFNEHNDIEDLLNRYGYEQVGANRYSCPNSKHGSDVRVNADNTSIHYSSYDNLEGKQTPFNLYCHFEHRDDIKEAVKDIAQQLGLDYASQYREEIRAKQQTRQAQYAPQGTSHHAQQVPHHAQHAPHHAQQAPQGVPHHAQQAPQVAQYAPQVPDFGPPPPPLPFFDEYEPIGYGVTEYDHEEPSYEDLLASCAVLESSPPELDLSTPSRNPDVPDLRKNTSYDGYQRMETAYDRFDWNAYKAQVASHFDLARYKSENAITDFKGGVFKSVCFVEFGHVNARKNWGKVLRAAAKFAGVPWPDFRRLGWTLDDTLDYAKRVASNFNVIELQQGEYLSQVFDYNSLPLAQVTHIVAPCGVGKTRAADTITPKSFYCPMSRQAETFAQSANGRGAAGEVVCEGYMHKSQDVIYGTYDAARKEIKQLSDTDKPLSLAGRTAFIDEVQHVSHDMYRKSTALEPLVDVSRLYLADGGRVVTLSGTPSPLLPFPLSFDASNVLYIKRVGEIKRSFFIFRESDPVEAILNRLKQGYTHLTYSIDDKIKCELICEALGRLEITALPIHSQNKNEQFHKAYTGNEEQDGVWDPNVQVYVTTRATVDGFNVRINTPNAKLAEMFDQSLQYGSDMIEQRSRRVRNYPADVYVGMSEKALEQLGKEGHFGLDEELNIEFERAEIMLNAAKALQLGEIRRIEHNEMLYGLADNIDDAIKQANLYILSQFKGWVRIRDDGELKIDALAINQKVKKRWVAKSHNTPDIMINELESLGFEFQGLVNLTGNKEDANKRKRHEQEVKRAKEEAKLTEIKTQADIMSNTQAQIVLENVSKVIKEEGDIGKAKVAAASLRRDLVKQGLTPSAAKERIQTLTSLRKDVIKRVENVIRQAKIRRAMTDSEFVRRADKITRFYATLQDGVTFKIGDVLQSSQIKERIVAAAAACGVPEILTPYTIQEKKRYRKAKKTPDERHDSNRKILKLIGDMFVLKKRNLKVNDQKINHYEFLSFNKVELAEFVPSQPVEPSKPKAKQTKEANPINPFDLLQNGLSEGYISQDIGENLTRLYENGWLTNSDFVQTLEEMKATYDPDW